MIKIMVIFGTRPEAIKMAPVIEELKKNKNKFKAIVCVTAQHREMLDQVVDWFGIKVDYDLNLMTDNQFLSELTSKALVKIEHILEAEKPDIVLVQGDTTTAMISALASYYQKIPVGYVESGLRTWDKYNPFPEEINRVLLSHLADLHFAPTSVSRENLLKEGIKKENIFITGNTVIDALFKTVKKKNNNRIKDKKNKKEIDLNKKFILITTHRRENFGEPLKNICLAIKELVKEEDFEADFILPVHKNPNVEGVVFANLRNNPKIHLVEPLEYPDFANVMAKSYLILSDSGGVQEEAPSLGKPVLVLRKTTERPEAVKAGTVKLVGTDKNKIKKEVKKLLENKKEYQKIAKAKNPYGNGTASKKIVKVIWEKLKAKNK